jgi:hypothetical protein
MSMLNFIYITVFALTVHPARTLLVSRYIHFQPYTQHIVECYNAAQELDQYQLVSDRSPGVCYEWIR